MRRRRRPRTGPRPTRESRLEEPATFTAPRNHLALWVLRLLIHEGVYDRLCQSGSWPSNDIQEAIHLSHELAIESNRAVLRQLLSKQLRRLERNEPVRDTLLFRNIAKLGKLLGLSAVDELLLAFAVTLECEEGLRDCFAALGNLPHRRVCDLIAGALGVSRPRVRKALRPGGVLLDTRLLELQLDRYQRNSQPVAIMDDLERLLLREHRDDESLMSFFFRPSPATALGRDDFAHVSDELELVVRYLRAALRRRKRAVNVLVHGPPGTGKTELARVAGAVVGAPLFEVSCSSDGGEALNGAQRFGAFRLCQRVLANTPGSVVLFDEIEDVFPRQISRLFGLMQSGSDKGWTNRLLESNPVPTLWVGNDIDQVDPAFIRRFDLIIELLPPPPRVRRRILEHHCGRLPVGPDWLTRTAQDERLHPGHIERATRVAKTIAPRSAAATERLLTRVIDGNLRACSGAGAAPRRARADACAYDLSLVNASLDLERLATGLGRTGAGTLCLHGPPGTGKSAFVTYLADRLGLPLHSRRASDLISCYVGSTEANLARMFRQATAQQALLFLDEADSFLQDRRRAYRSWEITEVNELLVQMESFDGIFVCATNLMESLDPAVFRRFALKARLDPLTPDQRWRMLAQTLAGLGVTLAEDGASQGLRRQLDRLSNLTPGDYAAVARRGRLLGETPDGARFVAALEEECAFKDGERRAVGFVTGGPLTRKVGT